MKPLFLLSALLVATTLWAADEKICLDPKIVGTNLAAIVASMTTTQVEAKVLKAYIVKDGNAVFNAYVAMWKNQEVVVSDIRAESNLKEGDTIKFMVMRMPAPRGYPKENAEFLMFMMAPEIPVYRPRVTINGQSQSINEVINRGMAKEIKGDWDGAIADFSKAIELNPTFADNYQMRGTAKRDKGDLDGAIADFTKAIDLNPQDYNNYFNRGVSKQDKNDVDGAIADFSKVIELAPKHSYAYNARGNAKKAKGDQAGADADFAQTAKLRGTPPSPPPTP